jgi:hypothetical protein
MWSTLIISAPQKIDYFLANRQIRFSVEILSLHSAVSKDKNN